MVIKRKSVRSHDCAMSICWVFAPVSAMLGRRLMEEDAFGIQFLVGFSLSSWGTHGAQLMAERMCGVEYVHISEAESRHEAGTRPQSVESCPE